MKRRERQTWPNILAKNDEILMGEIDTDRQTDRDVHSKRKTDTQRERERDIHTKRKGDKPVEKKIKRG